MSPSLILIVELLGTVAFSISGAMIALRKKMDIFGVIILGLTTAVGGGVIRDLILGITPPTTFSKPVYAITAMIVAVIIFLPSVRKLLGKKQHLYDIFLLLMDSVGLGVFTVVGIQTAHTAQPDGGIFLNVFVGVITGVGGGILRDIMAGLMPYVFVKHFYACASLAGALLCALLWQSAGELAAMLIGAAVILVLRLLASHYRWSLPHAE